MPKKKIVIIGTGFSSLISTLISISKGYKPTILESASSSRILDKHYKKKFFYDANFFGGLSNFWGGAISKIDKTKSNKGIIQLTKKEIPSKYHAINSY